MHIAVARVTIHIPESDSLKTKRSVVRSLVERIRHRFDVSVAEDDGQGTWQTADIGVACVSGSAAHAERVVNRVLEFIDSSSVEFEVVDRRVETMSGF